MGLPPRGLPVKIWIENPSLLGYTEIRKHHGKKSMITSDFWVNLNKKYYWLHEYKSQDGFQNLGTKILFKFVFSITTNNKHNK